MWWLRLSCGLDYEVRGLENLPENTAVVLAKHQSAMETIATQQFLPRQTWVIKRELLWIPLFGWGLAMTRPVAIDRTAGSQALNEIIEKGTRRLEQGLWVIIFPEGTRMAPGERGRYGIGGAMLAAKSGYPVIPLAHNAGEFWPRQGFRKRSGRAIFSIGPMIKTRGKSASQINAEAEEWIEAEVATLRAQVNVT